MKKKLQELLMLVMEANRAEGVHVFMEYAGHVEGLTVRITKKPEFSEWILSITIYLDSNDIEKEIDEMASILNKIIEENEIIRHLRAKGYEISKKIR